MIREAHRSCVCHWMKVGELFVAGKSGQACQWACAGLPVSASPVQVVARLVPTRSAPESCVWRVEVLGRQTPGGLSEILSVTCLLKSPTPCCGSVKLFKVSPDIWGLVRREPQARVEKSLEGCFRVSMLADVQGGPGRCPLGGCPAACGQMGWMTSPVLFLLWCPESAGARKDLIMMALVPAGPPMAS